MKNPVILIVALVAATGSAFPQDTARRPGQARNRWDGYIGWGAAFLPDSSLAGGNFGMGVEFLIKGGIGAGAELGIVAFGGGAAGMASANAVYQFVRSPFRYRGLVPFVTGGATNASWGGPGITGGNIGGGVNWWIRERVGLRMEARDYVFGAGVNCMILRLGITFR